MIFSKKPTLQSLSERRFTLTARILTDEDVNVLITNEPKIGACAWWNEQTKTITLNDGAPVESDNVRSLIFNRGKLFHELAHKLFTTDYEYRNECAAKAKDVSLYDHIRQTLEDGYIEQRIGKQWEGATPYIRSLLSHILQKNKDVYGALALFVRVFQWRDAEAKAHWGAFEKRIVEAVNGNSRIVCDVALEMSNALSQKGQNPQPQGEGIGESEKGEGKQPTTPTDTPESGESGQDTPESENEAVGDSESEQGESESESSGEGEEASEGEKVSGNADSGNAGSGSAQAEAESFEQLIESLVEEAIGEAQGEAEAEIAEMEEQIAQYSPEQDFDNGEEMAASQRIGEILRSTLVDSTRQKFLPVRRCGSLDSRRIVGTLTGGTFLRQRQNVQGLPHIALLLDVSGSMSHRYVKLASSARVLHGAIGEVGAKSMIAAYDSHYFEMDTIPTSKQGSFFQGGGTNGGYALQKAVDWLENEAAEHGLVIVITDGENSDEERAAEQFNRATQLGYFVLCVAIEFQPRGNLYHAVLATNNVQDLPQLLQEPLMQFVGGAL